MSSSGVLAGWYPDPDGKPADRYWDGQSWTDQTRPRSPMIPPYGSPPVPTYGVATNPPGDYLADGTLKPFSAAAIWSCIPLVWGLVGLIFAVVALNATTPTGDRRGRGAAIVGVCCNIGWLLVVLIAVASSSG